MPSGCCVRRRGVTSLASGGIGTMRISIPSLAAAAVIVAGCGVAPTGGGAGSGGASDGGGDAQAPAGFQPTATQDECAGLAPGDPGEPVRLQATGFGNSCDIATSDGSGDVAATITDVFAAPPRNVMNVSLFDGSGVSLGRFGYGSGPLFEQLAGFVGTSRPFQSDNSEVFAIDAHGNEIGRDSPGLVLAAAEDPTGGMVVFLLAQGNSLAAYDGRAHLRWRVPVASGVRGAGGRITLGVDRLGNTLVLIAEDAVSEIRGQWVDHDGHAGPQFTATTDLGGDRVNSTLILAPRIGDGLFLEEMSPQRPGWLAQFDSLVAAALPPPSWLSSRPPGGVHLARGGHAYAFFEGAGVQSASPCAQRI